jgi:hypothetical protein
MKKHEILSSQARAALFDPPTDPAAIVRHYTFSPEDMALIRQRRRAANRLGFAIHLAYLRFPGRALRPEETPPAEMLSFISAQIGCEPEEFASYARGSETRWEHLGGLQTYLIARPFRREDRRAVVQAGIEEGAGSDRGDAIVSALIDYLRERNIWLPASTELERLALAARAVARKRAYRGLAEGLSPETGAALDALLIITDERERTPFAWLREWPEAPRQKNLLAVVERLEAVRKLGVGADREKRIHRARYTAIAREIAILVPRDISRFDASRRLATLAVFAHEMEVALTDAALAMFDKMGSSWNLFQILR